jgi:hypothetical protein
MCGASIVPGPKSGSSGTDAAWMLTWATEASNERRAIDQYAQSRQQIEF